ncbi:MAG: OadG family protein [Thermotogota bacterium]|nr:OadG family protein [Thermotogota bacterium]
MSETIQVTILGLTIVFSVLTILAIMFALMGKFLSKDKGKPVKISGEKNKASSGEEKKGTERPGELSSRMVAVITSAVTQYIGHGDFVIRSVRSAETSDRWKQRKPLIFWKTGRQNDATNLQSNRRWRQIYR